MASATKNIETNRVETMPDIIREYLRGIGKETLPTDWYSTVAKWRSWYRGKVEDFHFYKQYNGMQMVQRERKSLGMAKKVCEDKADLLLNDKCSIHMANATDQEFLDSVFESTHFWPRANQLVELSAALGSGAFVEYLNNNRIEIDCISADCCFPLSWDGDGVKESAFASHVVTPTGQQIYINTHTLDDKGNYIINNAFLDKNGKILPLPKGMIDVINTNSPVPAFQYIKPSGVNNYDTTNPLGVSIYANAIDLLKSIDLIFDSYGNEFQLGKKRIIVRDDASRIIPVNGGSAYAPVFDANDVEFYAMHINGDEDKSAPVTEINMNIRAQEHELALQRHLDLLSERCGFGKGYYQASADSGVQTATEVISQNSQLFRRIRKDEIILNWALIGVVNSIFVIAGRPLPNGYPIKVNFDDSIVEDTDSEARRALSEVQSGIISRKQYLKIVYGLSDEQAQQIVDEADEEAEREAPPAEDPNALFGNNGGPSEKQPEEQPEEQPEG